MSTPIFISYAHKDEEWKDRVVTHLRVLELEGMLDVWDDRRIEAGDDWRAEIETAINAASIAVLLISANFLTSKFILDNEVPRLLQRRASEGVRVIPLIVKPCAWQQVKWLSPIQARPKDGKPLSSGNDYQIDTDLAALANEVAGIVRRVGSHDVRAHGRAPLPPDKISLSKLPVTDPFLIGRDDELAMMDAAWNNTPPSNSPRSAGGEQSLPPLSRTGAGWGGGKVNVLSLVAWGGVGKSALVNKWLAQMGAQNFRGAERVFGWSFYSQGATEGRQVSADQFIASALSWFGDAEMANSAASAWDKGERLAELVKQSRTLLVLDGLEPLQNPPPVETGRIKDPALACLVRELARQNPGLVVITTRLAVDDLKGMTTIKSQIPKTKSQAPTSNVQFPTSSLQIDLENLSAEAGAAYLAHLGVDGTDAEREDAARDFGGHALALTLMGSYLKVVHRGDVRKHHEIARLTDDQKQGAHARRVMESYERWLQGKPELDILRLMGLFDRPADKGALDALKQPPVIQGLTSNLQSLSSAQWQYAISNLRDLRLLAHPETTNDDTLDCHPLLREHFAEQLRANNPNAWREGNNRLYEYYKTHAKQLPDTIAEMAPLFAAVLHGCQAGKHQEAFFEVYWKRIQKGQEFFSSKKLGAMGSNLAVLSGFFDGASWRKPVDGLREDYKGFVLNETGFYLRALGRLAEAAQPMQAALETTIRLKDWNNAARYASNLSELYLTIGDVTQALTYAKQSVELADRSGEWSMRMINRTKVGDAQHQAGHLAEAETAFREAEELQKKNQPTFPLLYSVRGYQYCDLLLSQGNYAEVQRRASQTLEWAKRYLGLLDVALDNLSLGRAHMAVETQNFASLRDALPYLTRAVDGLRQAGHQEFITRGLLARAEYYRVTGAWDKAQRDLDEAFAIATRGGMGLYLADCHLGYARMSLRARSAKQSLNADSKSEIASSRDPSTPLRSAQDALLAMTLDDTREHLATAKEMIEKMGYHRRDGEVEELDHEIRE
jgi:tetratricopeptide (TPR) repeat protein